MLSGFPRGGLLRCTVTHIPDDADKFGAEHCYFMQDNKPGSIATLRNSDKPEAMGDILMPGGPITFNFGKMDATGKWTAAGAFTVGAARQPRWTALRLLWYSGQRAGRGEKPNDNLWRCIVVLRDPAGNAIGTANLTLQFQGANGEGVYPKAEEWAKYIR